MSTVSAGSNVAAQEEFGEAVSKGDLEAFDSPVSGDVVEHEPAPGRVPGAVASREEVAFAYTVTGTHGGDSDDVIDPRSTNLTGTLHGRTE